MRREVMLCGDAYAPVTSRIGFLRAPLDFVASGLLAWRRAIHGSAEACRLAGGLRDNVMALEPLTAGARPRELLVATGAPGWTAVFDCGVRGGDQTTTVGYLARSLRVQGVVVVSVPDVPAAAGRPPRFGARQLEMFGPDMTEFLNYVRTISVVRDGKRWRFDANGTVQHFEDVEAYSRRKIADRLTGSMLVAYTSALGLRPFEMDFFPGPSVLVRNSAEPPAGALVLSLHAAQQRAGIVAQVNC